MSEGAIKFRELSRKEICEVYGHLAIIIEEEAGKYVKWCPRCGEKVGSEVSGRIV